YKLNELLSWRHRFDHCIAKSFFFDFFDKVTGHGIIDVGIEQSEPDFAHCVGNVVFGEGLFSRQTGEHMLEFFCQRAEHIAKYLLLKKAAFKMLIYPKNCDFKS